MPIPRSAISSPCFPGARHDVLVLSDSDIAVAPDYLRKVAGALAGPGVGAVTCCYAGHALDNVWSRLSAMGIDYHFLPGVVFGIAHGLRPSVLRLDHCAQEGPCWPRSAVSKHYGDRLADDYEIGKAIRARGYRIALPSWRSPIPAPKPRARASPPRIALGAHDSRGRHRWAMSEVPSHTPFRLAILGAALSRIFLRQRSGVIAAALAARLYLKHTIDRILARRAASWLLPLRDVLSFPVFAGSFFAAGWIGGGSRYRVDAGGAARAGIGSTNASLAFPPGPFLRRLRRRAPAPATR